MAEILLTGTASLDIINHVSTYPDENQDIRVLQQDLRRGGNAANSAEVLSQFGHRAALNCPLANDINSRFIHDNLSQKNIILFAETFDKKSASPTSYITLNSSNGSRTILHHRQLSESTFQHFDALCLSAYSWFHFEGRNIKQTLLMMEKCTLSGKMISLEVEKHRNDGDIISLMPYANLVFISKPFAIFQGFNSATECLNHFSLLFPDIIFSCTWGEQGAWLIADGKTYHSPAAQVVKIQDSIGAGDTFNAAMINAFIKHHSFDHAIQSACHLASTKCRQFGFDNLIKL